MQLALLSEADSVALAAAIAIIPTVLSSILLSRQRKQTADQKALMVVVEDISKVRHELTDHTNQDALNFASLRRHLMGSHIAMAAQAIGAILIAGFLAGGRKWRK